MSSTAALYLAAVQHADTAVGKCQHQYYLGVRDMAEAVVRMVYDLDGEVDAYQYARGILEGLGERAYRQVLSDAYAVLEARRRATVEETVAVI